ncbi:MAG: hypothetical protein RTU30_12665 [Candidatus Thorarchaeota archaeon]
MDNPDDSRFSVTIDDSDIARCRWCGTTNVSFLRTPTLSFCSRDCMFAATYTRDTRATRCFLFLLLPVALFASLAIFYGPLFFIFAGIFLFAMVGLFYQKYRAVKFAERVPKDSRRDEGTRMRGMPHSIECPSCMANIDITKLGPDRIYKCEYCGDTGVVDIFRN